MWLVFFDSSHRVNIGSDSGYADGMGMFAIIKMKNVVRIWCIRSIGCRTVIPASDKRIERGKYFSGCECIPEILLNFPLKYSWLIARFYEDCNYIREMSFMLCILGCRGRYHLNVTSSIFKILQRNWPLAIWHMTKLKHHCRDFDPNFQFCMKNCVEKM